MDKVVFCDSEACDPEKCQVLLPASTYNFVILSQNIRSIGANFSGFLTLLERIKTSCDVIILSECWLSRNPVIPIITGYNLFKTSHSYNQNDGVVVYIKNTLSNVKVSEPIAPECNCLTITIGTDLAIIAIYRPYAFHDPSCFINSIDSVLLTLKSYRTVILAGDINIDIVPDCQDPYYMEYVDTLAHHGLIPGHVLPTHGLTCLDHINLKTSLSAKILVMNTTITDHSPVLLALSNNKSSLSRRCVINKIDEQTLAVEIAKIDFSPVFQAKDPNLALNLFMNPIRQAISDNTKPVVLARRRRPIKPWITPGLLKCMRHRDNLYKQLKKNPQNEVTRISYKRYRNYCTTILRKAKTDYEKTEFERAGNNSKQLWNIIKSVTNLNNSRPSACELLDSDNKLDSINEVNAYFAGIGKSLAEKIPKNHSVSTPRDPHPESFALLNTDETEVKRWIISLKNNCAIGWDGISSNLLKKHIDIVVPPLTYICNLALNTGVFPNMLKVAILHPIYKSGDRNRIENYRPISVLSAISKVLEKIINSRLVAYLETQKLLSQKQFGFRKEISAADAVHELVDYIVRKLDSGQKCSALFLDLTKAFDTVSIPILISKLESIGIRGTQLSLFASYLTGRTQYVKIDQHKSIDLPINYGVPQGSILGPTLFLIYINDLCNLELCNGTTFSYADDTALVFSGNNWNDTYCHVQRGFDTVSGWLNDNLLTLNLSKTKILNFSIRGIDPTISDNLQIAAASHGNESNVSHGPVYIEKATSITYLGVVIDRNLTFKQHISKLTARVRKLLYVFKLLRQSADAAVMKMAYVALCQSIISYCISTWGGAAKTNFIQIERAQRAVLKVCCFKPRLYPTKMLYEFCQVLTVRQLFVLAATLRQHSQVYYVCSLARRQPLGHISIITRTAFSHNFFIFLGPYLYKQLHKMLSLHHLNRHNLKIKLKTWLLEQSYDVTENLLKVLA